MGTAPDPAARVIRLGARQWSSAGRLAARPAVRRTLVRLGADAFGRVLQLATLVVVARTVDESTFGSLALGSAVGLVIAQATDLGLMFTVAADVARSRPEADRAVGSALASKAGLTALSAPAYMALFLALGGDGAALGGTLVAAAFALDSFVQFSAMSLRAAGAFTRDWVVLVVPRAAAVSIVVPAALGLSEPVPIGAAWLLAGSTGAVFAVALLASRLPIARPDRALSGDLFRRSWPIGASILAGMVYTRIGILALEVQRSSAEVAVYAVAYRLAEPTYMLPAAAAAIFYPSHARTLTERPASANAQLRRWTAAMGIGGLGVYVVLALTGPMLTSLLFGPFYVASGQLLAVLAFVVVPGFISYVLNQALVARGDARYNLVVMALLVVLSAVGNIVAVSAFGVWGAAGTAVAIEVVLLVALVARVTDRRRWP